MDGDIDLVLVEDVAADATFAMRVLARHTTRVVLARDGQQAIDLIFAGPPGARKPAAILLDLKLPKVGGLEVLRKLKGDDHTRDIPVVVMSSSRDPQDVAESYRLGANSYVVKPVDADEFERTITAVADYWLVRNERRR